MPQNYTPGVQLKHEVGYYLTLSGGALDGTGVYNWANIGLTELTGAFNPTTEETQYIGQSNKTTITTALAPSWSFNCERVGGDPINDDLYEVAISMLTGDITHQRSFIRVDLKNPHATATGWYSALMATMNVNMENFDQGAPGEKVSLSGTLAVYGDVQSGWFNITTKAWSVANPPV